MPPLTRQQTHTSIHSWWSDSNPGLQGPTINIHTIAKPLSKRMYHRQALEFIKKSRGVPLSSETLSIFSSYLPLNYVLSSTKAAVLAELVGRAEVEGDARAIVSSPVWDQIPQLLVSPNIKIWRSACKLSNLEDFGMNELRPLPNETGLTINEPIPTNRGTRIRRKDVSSLSAIDEALARQHEQRTHSSYSAKILLLGQAESGKSTILKNFQLRLAPKAFQVEVYPQFYQNNNLLNDTRVFQVEAWRLVVHLNLVRTVNFVLSLLEIRHPTTYSPDAEPAAPHSAFTAQLRELLMSLAPLREVEDILSDWIMSSRLPEESLQADRYHPAKVPEISIRSQTAWTAFLRTRCEPDRNEQVEELQTRQTLSACAGDIMTLWAAPEVQQVLKGRKIILQDQAGFFLDDVKRICQEDYIPTPGMLIARVHTVGLGEHVIPVHTEQFHPDIWKTWTIYEMGGLSGQRAAWAQFFDDVDVLIFLAPISAFNETLAETKNVNQLVESFELWRTICSASLLTSAGLILLCNKVDIFARKLESGVRFADYVTTYGVGPNEPKEIIKYLRDKFSQINRAYSLRQRRMDWHTISAIDTGPKMMAIIIVAISEMIIRDHLATAKIM
ncbi:G-protein alpha subunit-domain-containing protein [Mycena leptocephala]|nr:G-protein alpha subunit-domain-containing protein [Mycena leptocephala]